MLLEEMQEMKTHQMLLLHFRDQFHILELIQRKLLLSQEIIFGIRFLETLIWMLLETTLGSILYSMEKPLLKLSQIVPTSILNVIIREMLSKFATICQIFHQASRLRVLSFQREALFICTIWKITEALQKIIHKILLALKEID